MRVLILCVVATIVTIVGPTGFASAAIQFTVLDAPSVPGIGGTFLSGINNLGEVVGFYNFNTTGSSGNETRSVIWDSFGNPTVFAVAGSRLTYAYGINNSGQTVGIYHDETLNRDRAFLRNSDGTHVTIEIPGAFQISANGINDAGKVSGYYTVEGPGDDVAHGFIRDPEGTYNFFDIPGATQTLPWGINNLAQTTGYYNVPFDDANGFIRNSDGTVIPIDVPGFTSGTLPKGVNSLGQVTGIDATGHVSFVRDADGNYTTFVKPGSIVTVAGGLNDAGTIVGSFVDPDTGDISHGFIATDAFGNGGGGTVPEPASLTLWGSIGLFGLFAALRRRLA